MSGSFHLAQVNIARMNAPLESEEMAGFAARIDELNALADGSPGFVWRLQSGAGNATYLRPYDDDRILFNLSVWRAVEDLRAFVYRSLHAEIHAPAPPVVWQIRPVVPGAPGGSGPASCRRSTTRRRGSRGSTAPVQARWRSPSSNRSRPPV